MGLVRVLVLTLTIENVEGFMQECTQSCPFGGNRISFCSSDCPGTHYVIGWPHIGSSFLFFCGFANLLKSSSVVWLHYLRLHACKVNILAIELLPSSFQISSLSLTQLF